MWRRRWRGEPGKNLDGTGRTPGAGSDQAFPDGVADQTGEDRKSTRLNSSHGYISYAVFCLKKKKNNKSHVTFKHFYRGNKTQYHLTKIHVIPPLPGTFNQSLASIAIHMPLVRHSCTRHCHH